MNRHANISRRQNRRSGNVLIMIAIMFVVIVSMVAFAIDVGYMVHAKTELQRTADSCALAAVARLPDLDAARSAAYAMGVENYGTVGPDVEPADVEFGYWDRDNFDFATPTPSDQSTNAVRVTVRRTAERGNPLTFFFAHLIGTSQGDVTASAIAMYDRQLCGPFVGIEWLSAPGNMKTDSFDSGEGPYVAELARDRGCLCSDGPIGLEGSAYVDGDARAGKGYHVSITGSAVVTGNKGSRLKPLNLPSVDASEAQASNDNSNVPMIQKGNSWISPLDSQRNFMLDGNKQLTLPPGTYYFNDVSLSGQAVLNIDGPTTIYVTGNLERAGGVLVNNNTQRASNLKVLMTGGTANFTSNNAFYGVVYAPDTPVVIDGSSDFFGAVVGKTLTIVGEAEGHYDEALNLLDLEVPKRTAVVN